MTRTITDLEKELTTLRKRVAKGQLLDGTFGLRECKKSIKWGKEFLHESYESQYAKLVVRGLTENLFNTLMIVACEQLMKGESC